MGSGAGFKSDTETETGTGSGAGTAKCTLMRKGMERERQLGWKLTKERKMGTRTEDEGQDRGE